MAATDSYQLSKAAAERCEDARRRFRFALGQEPAWRMVFTDESSVNMLTTYRTMGRAYKGQRAKIRSFFQRGDRYVHLDAADVVLDSHNCRYSVLPALAVDGILYAHVVHGSFNGSTFKLFIQGLLQTMNPYPGPKSVLIMDNCAIHHVDGIQEMCDDRCVIFIFSSIYWIFICVLRGVKLYYLPPYSPDYNPIEECFSFMKSYIRRHGRRFRAEVEAGHRERPYLFLYEALSKVTAQQSWGWFRHSKYV